MAKGKLEATLPKFGMPRKSAPICEREIRLWLFAAAAAKQGVEVTPLSRYSHGGMVREGLQLGFAAMDAKEIRRGVRELAIALERKVTYL
jgi:DNA-binding transcriptional MocR family regulator